MLRQAAGAADGIANVEFVHNEAAALPFAAGRFGFVYSCITLQHVPREHIPGYVAELARVTAPDGTLAFHLPDDELPWRLDRASATRALKRLRVRVALGTRIARLRGRPWPSSNVLMGGLPEDEVRALLATAGLKIVDVRMTNAHSAVSFDGSLVLLEAATDLLVDKLYVARRPRD